MNSTPNPYLSFSLLSPRVTQTSLAVPLLTPSYGQQQLSCSSISGSGIPYSQEPPTTVCCLTSPPSSLRLLKLKHLITPSITTSCPASSALLPTLILTACVLPSSNAVCSVYVGKRLEAHESGVAAVKTFKFERERSKSWCQHCCQTL